MPATFTFSNVYRKRFFTVSNNGLVVERYAAKIGRFRLLAVSVSAARTPCRAVFEKQNRGRVNYRLIKFEAAGRVKRSLNYRPICGLPGRRRNRPVPADTTMSSAYRIEPNPRSLLSQDRHVILLYAGVFCFFPFFSVVTKYVARRYYTADFTPEFFRRHAPRFPRILFVR